MTRNWDLVRKILLVLEAQETASAWLQPDAIEGFDAELVGYHMRLLIDAGLIRGKSMPSSSSPGYCVAQALTWEGHEFLDKVRSDRIWNKVKAAAREKGVELSFDVIKVMAKAVIEALLGS